MASVLEYSMYWRVYWTAEIQRDQIVIWKGKSNHCHYIAQLRITYSEYSFNQNYNMNPIGKMETGNIHCVKGGRRKQANS